MSDKLKLQKGYHDIKFAVNIDKLGIVQNVVDMTLVI